MNPQVLLLAGTTEGRLLARMLAEHKFPVLICVATEHGRDLLLGDLHGKSTITVRTGRMNDNQLAELLRETGCPVLVDATHPYAQEVTRNAHAACNRTGTEYLRILRPAAEIPQEAKIVSDFRQAAQWLARRRGRILLTVGSKELAAFTCIADYQNRCYARVLPLPEVLAHCRELGFAEEHLIAAQGPFSIEENIQTIRRTGAAFLVTKNSGAAGGFPEKLAAVRKTGIDMVVISRPQEEGCTPDQALHLLRNRFAGNRGEENRLSGGKKA